jgi:hypothetical protein
MIHVPKGQGPCRAARNVPCDDRVVPSRDKRFPPKPHEITSSSLKSPFPSVILGACHHALVSVPPCVVPAQVDNFSPLPMGGFNIGQQ